MKLDDNRVVLITGTTRSIGKDLAIWNLRQNYYVIGCSRTASTIDDPRYTHYFVDVSDFENVSEMFLEISAKFGRLDALINNAAVNTPPGLLRSALLTTVEECLRVIKINYVGAFLCCRESVKLMRERSFGRIVNISSISAKEVFPGASMYSASKAALEQYTRVLASEVFDFGITANIVSLSVVEESGMADALGSSLVSDVENRTIIGRSTRREEIHGLIEFLLSENSSTITGQTIAVGG